MASGLALVFLAAWLAGAGAAQAADATVRVLHRVGDLKVQVEKGEAKPLPAEEETIAAGRTLVVGAQVDPKHQGDTVKAPPIVSAVLAISAREVATLASGASLTHTPIGANRANYALAGPVHLLIHGPKQDGRDTAQLHLTINGVAIDVADAHLFFDGWQTPATLTVLSGSVTLPTAKSGTASETKPGEASKGAPAAETSAPGADKGGAEQILPEAPAGPTAIASGHSIALDPAGPKVEPTPAAVTHVATWSAVPGFEVPGPYKHAGFVLPSDEKITVKRYGQDAKLTGKRIPIMEGDELLVPAGQKAEVQLDSKDRIVVTGEARFKVDIFDAKNVVPAYVFSIFGKVRALIAPKVPGALQMKSTTATIGVKGTDFEALASEANTDVSVIEGKVGVGDAAGANEVDVPAGFSTSVAKGAKPTPPQPLLPERMKELRGEGPGPSALNIVSPIEGQILSQGKVEFSVDPPSASVETLLDDKPVEIASGVALPFDLADGPHQLTVRGTAAGAISKTISFTVDRKPPALDPAITVAALTLVEGTPLVLKWTKPLASAEATYEGKAYPLSLTADGLTAPLVLDSAALKDSPTPIKLKAIDKAGNTATFDGTLTFRRKPAKPVVLTLSHADPVWLTNAPSDLNVRADRDVAAWEVLLDGKAETEKFVAKPESGKEQAPPRAITLGAALLAALADGDHPLSVKATDSFGTASEVKFLLKLDRVPPSLTVKNAKDGSAVALPAEGAVAALKPGRYEIAASKPLKALTVKVDGLDQHVALSDSKDRFTVAFEEPSLKSGDHTVLLQLADLAGNVRTLELKVRVESRAALIIGATSAVAQAEDREGTLRQAYEHTAAAETHYALDEMYLSERNRFLYYPTQATSAAAGQVAGQLYRQDLRKSVSKDLSDPFLREVQGP